MLVPYEVEKTHGFVYSVDNITLKYSSAKFRKKDSGLDYTIEAKLTLLIDNEKKVIDISPIAISSVKFKENTLNKKEKRSDIIMSQNGALLTEVSLKIVETNPEKVRAEKILSTWNNYKDSTKTIINNFLPKQSQTQGGGNTSTQNKSGNTSTGSGNSK